MTPPTSREGLPNGYDAGLLEDYAALFEQKTIDESDYEMLVEDLRRIAVKLRGAAQLPWSPIETAPKDQFIFLYCPEDDSRWLAKWQGLRWYGVDDEGLAREGYSAGDPDIVTGWAITHWMPLPPPPDPREAKP